MQRSLTISKLLILWILNMPAMAQSSSQYTTQASNCQSELAVLQGKKASIEADYKKIIDELKQGLFCSLCNRSKSQIEKGGVNFYQHIKDVKGNAVQAPQAAYDQAFRDYQNKLSSWQQDLKNKQQQCDNYQMQAQNAYRNEQNKIAQDNQQRQQAAQQLAYQRQQENAQKQQEAIQQVQQKIEEQKAIESNNRIQQQAQFSQTVNDYVRTQSADNQQRQQDAQQIADQGSKLAQQIQGNIPDITRIKGDNLSNSVVFSGAPSFDDMLSETPKLTPWQNIQNDIRDMFNRSRDVLSAKWQRLKDALPDCIKCTWNNEPIREITKSYVSSEVMKKVSEETGLKEDPRYKTLMDNIAKVNPVYKTGKAATNLADKIGNAVENFEGDSETNLQQVQEGIEDVEASVYFGQSNTGTLYKINKAFRNWFDCMKTKNNEKGN